MKRIIDTCIKQPVSRVFYASAENLNTLKTKGTTEMRVIYNDGLDPFFNLAAEEYLLENGATDYFMVWRNAKSVIIGKNQNAYGEINAEFCEKTALA